MALHEANAFAQPCSMSIEGEAADDAALWSPLPEVSDCQHRPSWVQPPQIVALLCCGPHWQMGSQKDPLRLVYRTCKRARQVLSVRDVSCDVMSADSLKKTRDPHVE